MEKERDSTDTLRRLGLKDSIKGIADYKALSIPKIRRRLLDIDILATESEIKKALITPDYKEPVLNNINYYSEIVGNPHMTDERLVRHLTDLETQCEEPPVYFPHNADFRGRLYPMCTGIHPQQGDVSKSLLKVKGKPLGTDSDFEGIWPTALGWLKIHTANTFGEDKITFEARVEWCETHRQQITDSVAGVSDFWKQADKPFCFLASCMDLVGYWSEGPSFTSTVPIAMDGMCNGSQHYAMMRRDLRAATEVSVAPSDAPKDLYTAVSDVVKAICESDKKSSITFSYKVKGKEAKIKRSKLAELWLNAGWDRKLTKRPTMCIVYGLTKAGAWEYVASYLDEELKADFKDLRSVAVSYMRDCIWEALFEVLTSSMETMQATQALARDRAKIGEHMIWTAPTGWRVVQRNVKYAEKRVAVSRDGKQLHQLRLRKPTDDLNISSQVNAIAPNIVHSLDASHLQLSVCRSNDLGVDSFVMIHDSFGVCATDAPIMAKCLREAFVEMYSTDILSQIFAQNGQACSLKKGDLETADVLDSLYFFA